MAKEDASVEELASRIEAAVCVRFMRNVYQAILNCAIQNDNELIAARLNEFLGEAKPK